MFSTRTYPSWRQNTREIINWQTFKRDLLLLYAFYVFKLIHIFSNNFSMLFTCMMYTIYHQVICGVLVKMEPKPMDVEDQRRLEIAPTWASLLAQPGYLPSSYNKTIPFCSITKIIVLPIIYSHLSSGKYRSSVISVCIVIDHHLRYKR